MSTLPVPNASNFDAGKLADIHLPEAISFWPIAPGWWLLLLIIIIFSAIIIYFIKRPARPKTAKVKHLKSQALNELSLIKKNYLAHADDLADKHETIKKISVFLRRYVLSLLNREQVASLTDEQWLELLDKIYHNQLQTKQNKTSSSNDKQALFAEKYADLLIHVPYQSVNQAIDNLLLNDLFDSTELLIKRSAVLFSQKKTAQKQNSVLTKNFRMESKNV